MRPAAPESPLAQIPCNVVASRNDWLQKVPTVDPLSLPRETNVLRTLAQFPGVPTPCCSIWGSCVSSFDDHDVRAAKRRFPSSCGSAPAAAGTSVRPSVTNTSAEGREHRICPARHAAMRPCRLQRWRCASWPPTPGRGSMASMVAHGSPRCPPRMLVGVLRHRSSWFAAPVRPVRTSAEPHGVPVAWRSGSNRDVSLGATCCFFR
jgi:hypothetical protein